MRHLHVSKPLGADLFLAGVFNPADGHFQLVRVKAFRSRRGEEIPVCRLDDEDLFVQPEEVRCAPCPRLATGGIEENEIRMSPPDLIL